METPPANSAARWQGLPESSLRKAPKLRSSPSPLPLAEQNRLAEKHLPLALSMARAMREEYPRWADEFESRALLELVEAARRHDESLGGFPGYARYRIAAGLAKSLRSALRKDRVDRLAVDRPDPSPVGLELEGLDAVEARLKKLPNAHAEVCRLAYVEGLPHSAIAAAVGRSRPDVSRIHAESLRLLREGRAAC